MVFDKQINFSQSSFLLDGIIKNLSTSCKDKEIMKKIGLLILFLIANINPLWAEDANTAVVKEQIF